MLCGSKPCAPSSLQLKFIFRLKAQGFRVDSLLISPGGRVEQEGIVGVTGRGSTPSALLIARRTTAALNISAGDGRVGFLPSLEYPGTTRHVAPLSNKGRRKQRETAPSDDIRFRRR